MDKRRVEGAWRLVNRIWAEFDTSSSSVPSDGAAADAAVLRRLTHRTVQAVTEAIEGFRFNSAIARLYEFVSVLRGAPELRDAHGVSARGEALSVLARLVAPFAPHLAEECWRRLGHGGFVAQAPWPDYDPSIGEEEERVLPVQINGKRRGQVRAPAGASAAVVEILVRDDPDIARRLEGLTVRKVIVVPDRIVNLVAE